MNTIHVLRPANVLAGFLALVAIGALAASDARAANSAETFVQSGIAQSYAILNDGGLSGPEKEQRFQTMIRSIVDIRRVGVFTLGPYARNATPADMETFEHAFANYLTVVYQRGLDNYSSLTVTGSTERASDDVTVNVSAILASGKGDRAQLAFRVRGTRDGGQSVTDLQVEGAWLAITQRAQFTAYLQQHDSDIAGLAMELERRAMQLRLTQSESEIRRRER